MRVVLGWVLICIRFFSPDNSLDTVSFGLVLGMGDFGSVCSGTDGWSLQDQEQAEKRAQAGMVALNFPCFPPLILLTEGDRDASTVCAATLEPAAGFP